MKGKINIGRKILCVAIALIMCGLAIILFTKKDYTATQVYAKTFNGVVEVKAYSNIDECGYGSAVCFSSLGYFITNAHILLDGSTIEQEPFKVVQIRFPDSEAYEDAKIINIDKEKDLAIIYYSGNHKLNPLKLETRFNTGDVCYAVGNGQNYGISITSGIISKKETTIIMHKKTTTAIQCDVNIAEGNSGGALINGRGKLIGITTFSRPAR